MPETLAATSARNRANLGRVGQQGADRLAKEQSHCSLETVETVGGREFGGATQNVLHLTDDFLKLLFGED